MSKRIIFFISALVSLSAAAARENIEWQLQPSAFGYSSYYGVLFGFQTSLAINVSERWQLKTGGSLNSMTQNAVGTYSIFTGPQYNFSEERSRSYFLGVGAGYGNQLNYEKNDIRSERFWSYIEGGKRFQLNDPGTWTYSPSIMVKADDKGRALSFYFYPVSFTYSF
jgi:hypothetical protein